MIPLMRLFGIQVKLHPIFVAMVALVFVAAARQHGIEGGILVLERVLLLFGFVLMHELGHSLMAKALGIQVYDIILWPLGGMARVAGMQDAAARELLVALAGPAINLIAFLGLLPFVGPVSLAQMAGLLGGSLLEFALAANLLMAVFNLIPAFPMDGGRVMRALLAMRLSHLSATRIAARVGRLLALVLAAVALLRPRTGAEETVLVLVVTAFLLLAGRAEERQALARAALPPAAP